MYQFFVDESQIQDKQVIIEGPDVNHIKNVLRMRTGEEFNVVTENSDKEYRCAVKEYADDEVICDLLFVKENNTELDAEIYLFQGLPKADKMELIIQKAVELGAAKIIPVAMDRSVVKLDGSREDKKIARWNSISESAAKQSKRRIIPEVTKIMSFSEAVNMCEDFDVKLLPYEMADMETINKTRKLISEIKPGMKVAIFIGPEGGFSEREIKTADEKNIDQITLGHRILRTETAGFVVLSWLVLQLEK